MNECLRKIPPHLTLLDVELLGHEPWRSTSTSVPLKEAPRFEVFTLLVLRERQEKSTLKKGAFGLAKRTSIGVERLIR